MSMPVGWPRRVRRLLIQINAPTFRTPRRAWRALAPRGCQRRIARTTMSLLGVRRDKAALSSGCKPHPATAPAGSNRSSRGGNEVAEAFDYSFLHAQDFDRHAPLILSIADAF